jgi:hypothetical protein
MWLTSILKNLFSFQSKRSINLSTETPNLRNRAQMCRGKARIVSEFNLKLSSYFPKTEYLELLKELKTSMLLLINEISGLKNDIKAARRLMPDALKYLDEFYDQCLLKFNGARHEREIDRIMSRLSKYVFNTFPDSTKATNIPVNLEEFRDQITRQCYDGLIIEIETLLEITNELAKFKDLIE